MNSLCSIHLNSPSDRPSSVCTVCLLASVFCRWQSRGGGGVKTNSFDYFKWDDDTAGKILIMSVCCYQNLVAVLWQEKKWLVDDVDKTYSDNPKELESRAGSASQVLSKAPKALHILPIIHCKTLSCREILLATTNYSCLVALILRYHFRIIRTWISAIFKGINTH